MKEKDSGFPWYMIYTPIVTLLLIDWIWDTQVGDGSMNILEQILNWLGMDDRLIVNVLIIVLGVAAVVYIAVRWIATNKRLKAIQKVADTAPTEIKTHIDVTSKNICNSISADKIALAQDLATIETRTGILTQQMTAVLSNRPEAPVQQGQLIAEISGLYALHDADQRTIASLRERIAGLEREKEALEQQNTTLQQKLDSLEPKPKFDHRLR